MIEITPVTILIAVFALAIIIFLVKGLVIVQQSEAMVIERLGEYSRTLEQGLHLLIPFIDQPRAIQMRRYQTLDGVQIPVTALSTRIDRREIVADFPKIPVITKDNVTVLVDAALYFQIITPKDAVLAVENLIQAIETLTQTSLRSKVGEMELDKLLESRAEINNALTVTLDEAGNKWGTKINRVEVQNIIVPEEVEQAMRKQMSAERERRATVTAAQGEKEAQINVAEGEKQAAILRAEGQRQAIRTIMEATGTTVKEEQILSYLIALEYMKTLPEIAKDGERVFLPYEASSLLGSIGSIKDLLPGASIKS
ncbi:SPFH domain-containing protein [Motiliproteus coralliicola]|uniref:SPFH domain-containing protein n=1 Tax=Motiliproteus coralliicola TaxID=2283196 RepID=UPI001A9DE2C5|nr:SPFH domain-containing protein [Motiliproteus coralliicola]